jgi:hypothetical protein
VKLLKNPPSEFVMHKDTPPYHPIHLPLNQEKCAIPIKEPKKKVVVELVCNIPQKRPLVLPMFVYVV